MAVRRARKRPSTTKRQQQSPLTRPPVEPAINVAFGQACKLVPPRFICTLDGLPLFMDEFIGTIVDVSYVDPPSQYRLRVTGYNRRRGLFAVNSRGLSKWGGTDFNDTLDLNQMFRDGQVKVVDPLNEVVEVKHPEGVVTAVVDRYLGRQGEYEISSERLEKPGEKVFKDNMKVPDALDSGVLKLTGVRSPRKRKSSIEARPRRESRERRPSASGDRSASAGCESSDGRTADGDAGGTDAGNAGGEYLDSAGSDYIGRIVEIQRPGYEVAYRMKVVWFDSTTRSHAVCTYGKYGLRDGAEWVDSINISQLLKKGHLRFVRGRALKREPEDLDWVRQRKHRRTSVHETTNVQNAEREVPVRLGDELCGQTLEVDVEGQPIKIKVLAYDPVRELHTVRSKTEGPVDLDLAQLYIDGVARFINDGSFSPDPKQRQSRSGRQSGSSSSGQTRGRRSRRNSCRSPRQQNPPTRKWAHALKQTEASATGESDALQVAEPVGRPINDSDSPRPRVLLEVFAGSCELTSAFRRHLAEAEPYDVSLCSEQDFVQDTLFLKKLEEEPWELVHFAPPEELSEDGKLEEKVWNAIALLHRLGRPFCLESADGAPFWQNAAVGIMEAIKGIERLRADFAHFGSATRQPVRLLTNRASWFRGLTTPATKRPVTRGAVRAAAADGYNGSDTKLRQYPRGFCEAYVQCVFQGFANEEAQSVEASKSDLKSSPAPSGEGDREKDLKHSADEVTEADEVDAETPKASAAELEPTCFIEV